MNIIPEIDLSFEQQNEIQALRNQAFPDHQAPRTYYKQLPHLRALQFRGDALVGQLGLDYRAVKVGNEVVKVLGIIDFCVDENERGKGTGTQMLSELHRYASERAVDFIVLISDLESFYTRNGFQRKEGMSSWLRIHEHTNFGVAVDHVDDLYVKALGNKVWPEGHLDWLGYMF